MHLKHKSHKGKHKIQAIVIGCGPAFLSFFSVYHRVNLNWIQHIVQDEGFFLIKDQDCALVCQLLSSFVNPFSVRGQHSEGATLSQVALAEWCDAVVSMNSSTGKLVKLHFIWYSNAVQLPFSPQWLVTIGQLLKTYQELVCSVSVVAPASSYVCLACKSTVHYYK